MGNDRLGERGPAPEREAYDSITAFEQDPPLGTQFPLRLKDGTSVPGVHVVCSRCGQRISGDRVHGRAIQSLQHVITITAHGMCVACDRITRIDCRFRFEGNDTVVEWLASNGRWQSRQMRPASLRARFIDACRRVLAEITGRSR